MFGIGMPELILIAVVALIVLGPKRLPDLAKSMGRAIREFKKATGEIRETLQVDSEINEVKKAFQDFQADVNKTVQSETERKEEQSTDDPPPTAPAVDAAPSAPSSTDKLDDLKKAFDTWNAPSSGDQQPEAAGDQTPQAAPASPSEKPKST